MRALEPGGSCGYARHAGAGRRYLARTGAPRLDYHFDSDISLVKYLSNSFDDPALRLCRRRCGAQARAGFFSWLGRASFTQSVLDPLSPATPDNLESITYLRPGPVHFPSDAADHRDPEWYLLLRPTNSKSPLYVDIDSQRYRRGPEGLAGVHEQHDRLHRALHTTRWTSSDQVENTNFDQKQASVGITLTDTRTLIDASVGYTQLKLYPTASQPLEDTNTNPGGISWAVNVSRA